VCMALDGFPTPREAFPIASMGLVPQKVPGLSPRGPSLLELGLAIRASRGF
jgi:hypothetical protein